MFWGFSAQSSWRSLLKTLKLAVWAHSLNFLLRNGLNVTQDHFSNHPQPLKPIFIDLEYLTFSGMVWLQDLTLRLKVILHWYEAEYLQFISHMSCFVTLASNSRTICHMVFLWLLGTRNNRFLFLHKHLNIPKKIIRKQILQMAEIQSCWLLKWETNLAISSVPVVQWAIIPFPTFPWCPSF